MDTATKPSFRPTHMAFATFWNFIEELAKRPLPPQIDRSLLRSKSGTDQSNLMSVLSSFGLVSPTPPHNVEPEFETLATADEEARKAELGQLIRRYYAPAVELSEKNGTEQQLHQVFKDQFGMEGPDTRRKAVTFFLHAARTAGLPISPHFPATRSGSGAPGTSRPKRTTKRKPAPQTESGAADGTPAKPKTSGDSFTVNLASGGLLSVLVNVNLFDLSTEDRDFVIDIVDKLKGYAAAHDGRCVMK